MWLYVYNALDQGIVGASFSVNWLDELNGWYWLYLGSNGYVYCSASGYVPVWINAVMGSTAYLQMASQ